MDDPGVRLRRPEQFVEDVAKPRLEHVHLALGDGHALGAGGPITSEITRFLAWQAARTPGWMEIVERWANEFAWDHQTEVVEPPPDGFDKIRGRMRPMCLEDPNTGDRREVTSEGEFHALRRLDWKWILRRDDHLEMPHLAGPTADVVRQALIDRLDPRH
jgi:hypothetical protein